MGQAGWVCTYPATHQDLEDTTRGCDSLDNDCDGRVDEPFRSATPCTVGSGACAGTGTWVCDNTMAGNRRCMGSPKTPGTEVCNGLDDDCDGKVDELRLDVEQDHRRQAVSTTSRPRKRHDVRVRGDAATTRPPRTTASIPAAVPCSVAGGLPWSNVTKEEAEAACEAMGTAGACAPPPSGSTPATAGATPPSLRQGPYSGTPAMQRRD
jgi:hypothetical protein